MSGAVATSQPQDGFVTMLDTPTSIDPVADQTTVTGLLAMFLVKDLPNRLRLRRGK